MTTRVRDAVGPRTDARTASIREPSIDWLESILRLAYHAPRRVAPHVLMPGRDGLEVCRRMLDPVDRTPVLMADPRDGVADVAPALSPAPTTICPSRSPLEDSSPSARAAGGRSAGSDEPHVLGACRFDDL